MGRALTVTDLSHPIYRRRVALGLLRRELAQRCDISEDALARYEHGKGYPRPGVMRRLADEFGISTAKLAAELYGR